MAVLEALFGISVRSMAETKRKGEERSVREKLEQWSQKPVVVVNTDGEREQWQLQNNIFGDPISASGGEP